MISPPLDADVRSDHDSVSQLRQRPRKLAVFPSPMVIGYGSNCSPATGRSMARRLYLAAYDVTELNRLRASLELVKA